MTSLQKWAIGITIPVVIAAFSGAYTLVTQLSEQSRKLGGIEADNRHLSSQNADLMQQNASLRERLDNLVNTSSFSRSDVASLQKALEDHQARLTNAYGQIEHLQSENARLAFLADSKQRCAPYREEIATLQDELAGKTTFTVGESPEPERKAEIKAHLKEHHANLRACLGAKP